MNTNKYINECLSYYGIMSQIAVYENVFSLMQWLFKDSKTYLPIQMCFYFTVDEHYKDGVRLNYNSKILCIGNLSFSDLIGITQDLINSSKNFIGWVTNKDFDIDYFVRLIKKLYPDKQYFFQWPESKDGKFTGVLITYKL